MRNFQVGMKKTDITPPLGTLLYGYPYDRVAEDVLDRLSIGALAIRQDEKLLVMINAEVCLIDGGTQRIIRQTVAQDLGIALEDVICSATHTHSGPITKSSAGWGSANTEYIEKTLIPKAVEVAKAAVADMQDAVMAVGVAETKTGVNRRQITADGEVILGQNPEGLYDPKLTVIRFQTPEGKAIGNMAHLGVHPTSAGGTLSITRDWPGHLVDGLEEVSGAPCLFYNGASGDVGPRLRNGRSTGEENAAVAEIGLIARADALIAYERATQFHVPKVASYVGDIVLHYAPAPTYEEVLQRMEAMGDPSKLIEVDISTYAQLKKMKDAYEKNIPFPEETILHQTVLALGDVGMVTSPFETFCKISLDIQAGSPFEKTVFICLSNDDYGYLPTADQLPYGGYEVDSFRAAGMTGFREDTAQLLVDGNVALLKELHKMMQE